MAKTVTHSADFDRLKKNYEMNYVTVDQLRRYVALHEKRESVGITPEEFKEITGEEY